MHVAENFTGMPGIYVPVEGNNPRFQERSSTAKWMNIRKRHSINVGTLDDVIENAKKLQAEA